MDNIRLLLTMAWLLLAFQLYLAWQQDYGKKPAIAGAPTATAATPTPGSSPLAGAAPPADLPNPGATANSLPAASNESALQSRQRIQVATDLYRVEIDTLGGDLRRVDLVKYPVEVNKPDQPIRMLNDTLPNLFVLQSGLLAGEEGPNHQAEYRADQASYTLAEGQNSLEVKLHWQSKQGTQVAKIYRFHRDNYAIDVEYQVTAASQPWEGRVYGQIQRTQVAEANQSSFIYTYMGGAFASPATRFHKITFEQMHKAGDAHLAPDGSLSATPGTGWNGGWLGMLQHYFVAAVIPDQAETFNYYTKLLPGVRYVFGLYGPTTKVEAGQQRQFKFQFYAGPKSQNKLEALSPGLDLTADYGFLWFLAKPLFWLMEWLYALLGNWGWAIIVLTLLIKLAFFHLSAASYKSMANLRRMQPRMMALKERYGDDRAGLNQAMMDLYRKEKINPLGGCLPILVQIPVFIALYWVLLESVELRQASFMGWIQDLSIADPYFILPLIMGVTMIIQQKLNPAPMDPIQEKMMMILPVVFTVFFAFFPAGLVLYWVVNNILSITQQWYITKQIEGAAKGGELRGK
jgi:YidC/Oxa1 family membrane protein insertase